VEEKQRIRVMIAEGYDARPFSDLVLETDRDSFEDALARLVSETQRLMRENRRVLDRPVKKEPL
jgi:hypothetical protein